MTRNGAKGSRKNPTKTVARAKLSETAPAAPRSAAGADPERDRVVEYYLACLVGHRQALRDLLAYYRKVTGEVSKGDGWTAADMQRLAEIRDLVEKP